MDVENEKKNFYHSGYGKCYKQMERFHSINSDYFSDTRNIYFLLIFSILFIKNIKEIT